MALAGDMGVELYPYEGKLPAHAVWFGEDQGRYVLAVAPAQAEEVLERARLLALPARIVGKVGGDAITIRGDEDPYPLAKLRCPQRGLAARLHGRALARNLRPPSRLPRLCPLNKVPGMWCDDGDVAKASGAGRLGFRSGSDV